VIAYIPLESEDISASSWSAWRCQPPRRVARRCARHWTSNHSRTSHTATRVAACFVTSAVGAKNDRAVTAPESAVCAST